MCCDPSSQGLIVLLEYQYTGNSPMDLSRKLLNTSDTIFSNIWLHLWITIETNVYIHFILIIDGMDKARIGHQLEWTQPERIKLLSYT